MTFSVVHVLDDTEPQAGSAVIGVGGLSRALERRDVSSVIADVSAVVSGGGGQAAHADIVHFHGWNGEAFAQVADRLSHRGTPYVLSPLGGLCRSRFVRSSWWNRLTGRLKPPQWVRRAAALTAFNEAERNELAALGVHSKIQLLPCGLEVSAYEVVASDRLTAPPQRDGLVALVLGPIHPSEGLAPLLKAAAEAGMAEQGWSIVLAGTESGEWRRMIEAAVNRKRAGGRVRFAMAENEDSQRELLRGADALIVPGLKPRCPVTVLQGLAAGVPVIATRAVCPDALAQYVHACAASREGLRAELRALMEGNPAQRRTEALRIRSLAMAAIDWSVLCETYLELYHSLLSPRNDRNGSRTSRHAVSGSSTSDDQAAARSPTAASAPAR